MSGLRSSGRRIAAIATAFCLFAVALVVLTNCSDAESGGGPSVEAGADSAAPDAAAEDSGSLEDTGAVETDGGFAWIRFANFVNVDHTSDVPGGPAVSDHFDVGQKGTTTPLFASIETATVSSVTGYARVPAGVATRFEFRDSTKDPASTVPLAQSQATTLKAGGRYTVFAMGNVYLGSDTVRLLALEEGFTLPPSGSISARYVAAMALAGPNDVTRFGTDENVTFATVSPYDADVEEGVAVATSVTHFGVRLLATASSTVTPWFTATADALKDGGRYFVVLAPLPCATNCNHASRDLGLFAIPAGDSVDDPGAVTLLRQDPRIYILHMLSGASEGLEVYANARKVATRVPPVSPRIATLPAKAEGLPLSFTFVGASTPVLQDAPTGTLEAGKKYLGVLVGDPSSLDDAKRPRLVVLPVSGQQQFLNAAINGPPAVDLGYMSLRPEGGTVPGDTFTPMISGATHHQRVEGTSFNLPVDAFGKGFYAVRAAGSAERPRFFRESLPLTFLILFGDWNDSLRLYYGSESTAYFGTFPPP